MPLQRLSVKHVILQGTIDILDNDLANYLSQGYKVADVKILHYDIYNQDFKVFYILTDNGK